MKSRTVVLATLLITTASLLMPAIAPQTALADATWASTGGPGGGGVSLAYDSTHNILYAGTGRNGVWKYDGTTWTDTGGWPVSSYEIDSLAYDATHNMLYAGCYDSLADAGRGVWKYDGTTWTDTGGWPVSSYSINSLAYDSTHNVLYAADGYFSRSSVFAPGVWKYDGTTWTNTGGGVSTCFISSLAYDSTHNVLYAGAWGLRPGYGGVWKYDGTTWTDTGGSVSSYSINSLAYDSTHNVLFAGAASPGPILGEWYGEGVWKYDGTTWTDTGGGVSSFGIFSFAYDSVHNKLYAGCSYVYDYQREGRGVWVYDGTTWTDTGGAIPPPPQSSFFSPSLAYDSVHGVLYAGWDRVWKYGGGNDSGFKPYPDGFGFKNAGWGLSWEAFCKAFPDTHIGANDLTGAGWVALVYGLLSVSVLEGNCFGMSSKSVDLFSNTETRGKTYDNPEYPNIDWIKNNISPLQCRQLGTACMRSTIEEKRAADELPGRYVQRALENVRNCLNGNYSQDPIILCIKSGGAGHALVPYKIVDESNISKVYVYDSRHEGDSGKYVIFDKNNYSWSYDMDKYGIWKGTSNQATINTCFLSTIRESTVLPGICDITLAALKDLYYVGITDNIGQRLGYFNGQYYDDIPKGTDLIPATGGEESSQILYYLEQPQDIDINIQGKNDGSGQILIGSGGTGFAPRNLDFASDCLYDFSLHPSRDELVFSPKKADVAWDMCISDIEKERVCQFANTQTVAGETYYFQSLSDGDSFSYKNSGSNKTYDLKLDSNGKTFEKDGISIDGSDTEIVTASNWDNLGRSDIILKTDENSDGTIDKTTYLQKAPPHISSISPTSGPVGTEVTVKGNDFGSTQDSSCVTFNGKKATSYPSWTDTQIKVAVPSEATTGPVQVTTAGGTSNGKTFTIIAKPEPKPKPKPKPAKAVSSTYYLAEGSTNYGFDCYITIQNPNTTAVTAQITYMTGSGPVTAPSVNLPAKSQATINPKDVVGNNDFSTKVVCKEAKTIAVDRTMTWTGPGAASPEAHSSIGVTSPAKIWYLPEGSSKWGFETWLLIQNPNSSEAKCDVTYMIEGEGPKTVSKSVPANSRKTFNIADDIGEKDASIKVEGNIPVIPERAMYRNNRREGHDSIGTTSPNTNFYLAEGTSAYGFTTYVLVQNPNSTPTDVTVTYMTGEGPKPQAPFSMDANSRKTIKVNDVLPNTDFSTQVHGAKPIIAERAMYWDNGTGEACHDSVGMASAHTSFYLPDGQTSEGRETYTLVQNPNSSPVTVQITYMTPTGAGNKTFTDTIAANSRMTYNMVDKGISGRAAVMVTSKTSGKKIMVERAMYWNNRGAGTDTIGGYGD